MSKKDLFRIIMKLFGLYLVIGAIAMIPQALLYLIAGYDLGSGWGSLMIIIVILIIAYIFVFQPNMIINLFGLNKGYDDDRIEANQLNPQSVISIGLVIISVYFIVDNLPEVLTKLFLLFKESFPQNKLGELLDTFGPPKVNKEYLIIASLKLVMGLILIFNKTRISKKLVSLHKDEV